MTLKIDIFPFFDKVHSSYKDWFFVLFSSKNVKQKDPDQFFQEMSHLKAFNFFGTSLLRGP
jgi:hypothetical protein